MNIYLQLTGEFNDGRRRAILSGGQAVVLHRLAIMSKDGDWILREDDETMRHVQAVLATHGACYRFGAPLDIRWLAAGWSSHFEFIHDGMRIRTDFVTRPPRIARERLAQLWIEQAQCDPPFLRPADLIETKKTNREKDYAVIGALAETITDTDQRLIYSRSARELMELSAQYPAQAADLSQKRPLLKTISKGLAALEAALDAERRGFMHANEARLARYMAAAEPWAQAWPAISKQLANQPLVAAHKIMVEHAESILPFEVPGGWP